MAGDGMTDEEAIEFWKQARLNCGTKFPALVKEVCEVALLGGALLVAEKFSESWIILALYWLLLIAFALRIAAHIAFPKAYDSPVLPLLAGLALTVFVTVGENSAIRSAANAAMIQLQSEKAGRLMAAQREKAAAASRLTKQFANAECADTERVSSKRYNYDLCNKLSIERYLNDHSTDKYLVP
jgi:uncharacterized SAM-binding protein YcdF (DUF218 family)